jgi:hypothetical protein
MHIKIDVMNKYLEVLFGGLIKFFQISWTIKKCGMKVSKPMPAIIITNPKKVIGAKKNAQ